MPGAGSGVDRSRSRPRAGVARTRSRLPARGRVRMTETLNYRQTIARAISDEMDRDERVILLGEDVARAGGAFKTTVGLFDRFGGERVRDTPISEQAIVGAALGAAI